MTARATQKKQTATRENNSQNREIRLSREQETWDNLDIHDFKIDEDGSVGNLPNIPARDGYAQRWMRTEFNGEYDAKNVAKKANEFWRRRDPSTVPKNYAAPTRYVDGLGETIGASGMVLVERPLKIHEKFSARVKAATKAQRDAVDHSLFNTKSEADHGFGTPYKAEDKTVANKPVAMPIDD